MRVTEDNGSGSIGKKVRSGKPLTVCVYVLEGGYFLEFVRIWMGVANGPKWFISEGVTLLVIVFRGQGGKVALAFMGDGLMGIDQTLTTSPALLRLSPVSLG